tara:strand:- start:731 stop:1060 length:330 start_codon:yes stop_codon:yes gene_type:complete
MAQILDLTFIQGDDYKASINLTDDNGNPTNLSGFAVAGKIRNRYGDSTYLLSLSPTISSIAGGVIDIDIAASGTSSLPVTEAVFDIEIYQGASVTRVLEGNVKILPQVL